MKFYIIENARTSQVVTAIQHQESYCHSKQPQK